MAGKKSTKKARKKHVGKMPVAKSAAGSSAKVAQIKQASKLDAFVCNPILAHKDPGNHSREVDLLTCPR